VRQRQLRTFTLKDDGRTPNPHLPMIVYHRTVGLPTSNDPTTVFEELFGANGRNDAWRDSIYCYLHYHSRCHEVLGVAPAAGGGSGHTLTLKAGDVVIMRRHGAPASGFKRRSSRGRSISSGCKVRGMSSVQGRS
jgi:uncharacterized protein YjlB